MKKFLAFVTLLVVSLSLLDAKGFTTNVKERPTVITVRQMPDWTEPPLEIVGVGVGDRNVAIGRSFQASDTWLRDLTVTVKNVSQVSIVGFNVGVLFQKDLTGDEVMPPIEMRRGIDYSMGQLEGENIVLRPGETMQASVGRTWYEHTMLHAKHLANLPEDILNNVSLHLIYAGYNPDNIWLRGNHMHRKDAETFTTDEEYGRKMRKMANLMHEQKEKYGLIKASYKPVTPCVWWDDSAVVKCTGLCSGCSAVKDLYHQQENAWKYSNPFRGCQRLVDGELVSCGCCIRVDQVNIGIAC